MKVQREAFRASFQSQLWHECLFEAETERNLPEEQNRWLLSVPLPLNEHPRHGVLALGLFGPPSASIFDKLK